MVPDSGEIVALASLPSYDPNKFWVYSADERRNRAVEDNVLLGGVSAFYQKAAALEGRVVPEAQREAAGATGSTQAGYSTAAWSWVGKGMYVSPEFNRLGGSSVEESVFAAYAERIGLVEAWDRFGWPDLIPADPRTA